MRLFRDLLVVVAALTLGACATALTPRGNSVRIVDRQADHQCTFVGTVTGSNMMGNTMADDAQGALNEMRNKAAQMGANAIRVLNVDSRMAGTAASAEALNCKF
jgi:uncharacterized protein YbjQ (UPF0145 family)